VYPSPGFKRTIKAETGICDVLGLISAYKEKKNLAQGHWKKEGKHGEELKILKCREHVSIAKTIK
jgi:hypothetical protein